MGEVANLIGQFLLTFGGFLALALSQSSQLARQVGPQHRRAIPAAMLRLTGVGLLVTAATFSVLRDGPVFGALLWVESLPLGALAVALILTRPRSWVRALLNRRP